MLEKVLKLNTVDTKTAISDVALAIDHTDLHESPSDPVKSLSRAELKRREPNEFDSLTRKTCC